MIRFNVRESVCFPSRFNFVMFVITKGANAKEQSKPNEREQNELTGIKNILEQFFQIFFDMCARGDFNRTVVCHL